MKNIKIRYGVHGTQCSARYITSLEHDWDNICGKREKCLKVRFIKLNGDQDWWWVNEHADNYIEVNGIKYSYYDLVKNERSWEKWCATLKHNYEVESALEKLK